VFLLGHLDQQSEGRQQGFCCSFFEILSKNVMGGTRICVDSYRGYRPTISRERTRILLFLVGNIDPHILKGENNDTGVPSQKYRPTIRMGENKETVVPPREHNRIFRVRIY